MVHKTISIAAVLMVAAVIIGLGPMVSAGKSGPSITDHGTPMAQAIAECGFTQSEVQLFYDQETHENALGIHANGVSAASYGIWSDDLSFASMGAATPGYVWGKSNGNEDLQIWYVHTSPNGGIFTGIRSSPAAKGPGGDSFCGTWDYSTFTLSGYANEAPFSGTWLVWWN